MKVNDCKMFFRYGGMSYFVSRYGNVFSTDNVESIYKELTYDED